MAETKLEHVGTDCENNRELYLLQLDSSEELSFRFDSTGQFSIVLLVWDASKVSTEEISRLARKLINTGGVYFCTWGPDCERVHDLIDEEWVGDGFTSQSNSTIMTTWHIDCPLADAIWFALFAAFPMNEYREECRSVIAVCIHCPQWAADVRYAFTDPLRFSNEFIGQDE